MDLRSYRQQYNKGELDRDSLEASPFDQFEKLFTQAKQAGVTEPNAMTLATADQRYGADARIVLLKEVLGEKFIFFTNYLSAKGRQLAACPHASLLFWWPPLETQIRIRGDVRQTDSFESDSYFNVRPHDSRAGAIASHQSQIVENYDQLIARFEELKAMKNEELIRPKHWGGYELAPIEFEFWQGRPNRMHDRFLYQWDGGKWVINRLSP
ncbi:MAG: pyridoxamine 5'-phosphate oxidase [Saprospiraceae bacterium]|nr:pyridoxamine 5'-phosphate oxidase [Saprospiraceae bacterium]